MKAIVPNARILVIGAGVSGLTTALCLLRRGLQVTVIAEKFAPQITSNVAGALWEWPPAVCGYHQDQVSLARSKDWCVTSYQAFTDIARQPETGVFMRPVTFYFRHPVIEDQAQLRKMNELRDKVRGFRHDEALISTNGVSPDVPLRDAYSYLAPMVDTDRYMKWLLAQVKAEGGTVLQQRLPGILQDQEAPLLEQFQAAVIVNCTGLGAHTLANDDMYPIRGALIRVRNDGKRFPRIEEAHCVSHDEASTTQDIIFIVPRGEDMLVLGGLTEPDQWELDIGFSNYEPVRDMYRRCVEFLPILRHGEIDGIEPVRVGLRPFRRASVRLEHEPGTRIIHNYGHGGSGVTFSWGCAAEVAETVLNMPAIR